MDIGGSDAADRHVEGVVEMMLDATQHFDQPLTDERLFAGTPSLFPTGRSGMHRISVGAWRDDRPGRCRSSRARSGTSASTSKRRPAARLDDEMRRFLDWFNGDTDIDPVSRPRSRICGS